VPSLAGKTSGAHGMPPLIAAFFEIARKNYGLMITKLQELLAAATLSRLDN
jgi:hypothetical protein